jgi:asparagine synthase (glutamine-hydrolysing)
MSSTGAYYAEELAAGQLRKVYACLQADGRELGIRKTLWWLCRYGVVPLLPEPIKAPLRKVRRVDKRDSWLSSHLQETLERRRSQLYKPVPVRLQRRAQGMQIQILEGAFDAMARESEERLCSSLQLELRKPLFNEKLIQFAFSTPERLRSRGHTTKWLHRQALKGLLPALVLNRAAKAEFSVAFRRHLDSISAELVSDIVSRRAGWVQPERAITLCENYHKDTFSGWAVWRLWSLVGCDALSIDP